MHDAEPLVVALAPSEASPGHGFIFPMMTQYLRVRRARRPPTPSRSRHRPPGVLVAPAQKAQFWTARVLIGSTPMDAHNGGSARGYLAVGGASQLSGMAYWMLACSVYLYIAILGANVRICRGQGRALRGTARTLATPRGQSGTVNSASRGRGLMGKLVTESNLCLCVPAQIPGVLTPDPVPHGEG